MSINRNKNRLNINMSINRNKNRLNINMTNYVNIFGLLESHDDQEVYFWKVFGIISHNSHNSHNSRNTNCDKLLRRLNNENSIKYIRRMRLCFQRMSQQEIDQLLVCFDVYAEILGTIRQTVQSGIECIQKQKKRIRDDEWVYDQNDNFEEDQKEDQCCVLSVYDKNRDPRVVKKKAKTK